MKLGESKRGDFIIVHAQCEQCGEEFDMPASSYMDEDCRVCGDCAADFIAEGSR